MFSLAMMMMTIIIVIIIVIISFKQCLSVINGFICEQHEKEKNGYHHHNHNHHFFHSDGSCVLIFLFSFYFDEFNLFLSCFVSNSDAMYTVVVKIKDD